MEQCMSGQFYNYLTSVINGMTKLFQVLRCRWLSEYSTGLKEGSARLGSNITVKWFRIFF